MAEKRNLIFGGKWSRLLYFTVLGPNIEGKELWILYKFVEYRYIYDMRVGYLFDFVRVLHSFEYT